MNMKINENKNGLKGQYNLARGNALGCETIQAIVRVITIFGGLSFFRTNRHESQFRPKEVFRPDYCIWTDGFLFIPFTPDVAWG